MLRDDHLVAQLLEQQDGLDAHLHVVVAGKLVAEEVHAPLAFHRFLPICLEPFPQRGAVQQRQRAPVAKAKRELDGLGDGLVPHKEVGNGGGDASYLIYIGDVGDQPRAQRNAVLVVVVLQEFGLQLGHIHVRGAFRFAPLARQAQAEDIVQLAALEGAVAAGKHLAQHVGAGTGGLVLVLGGHVAGAHRSSGEDRLAAVARSVAALGRP